MDKTLMLSVAGSGKTKTIVDILNESARALIITYTDNNYENIQKRLIKKFGKIVPKNICLMTYFSFLFNFCYKPFLSDIIKAKGIIFESNNNRHCKSNSCDFFLANKYFYSNRLAYFLEKTDTIKDIKERLEKYFDLIIIDEVQDIAGRDFNFLLKISSANNNFLYVGDFYQHTYDTSLDGNVRSNLFDNYTSYINEFRALNFIIDTTKLDKTWRCAPEICNFIASKLGINILSHKNEGINFIKLIEDDITIKKIINDEKIIKLHYKNSSKFGGGHKNWGDTKGIDDYEDVCVLLNKKTFENYKNGSLLSLPQVTKNKLYVAITRAHGNVYLINESLVNKEE